MNTFALPRLPGFSLLPSTFVGRPMKLHAKMPCPVPCHGMVVAKNRCFPGTNSSGLFTYGTILSSGILVHAVTGLLGSWDQSLIEKTLVFVSLCELAETLPELRPLLLLELGPDGHKVDSIFGLFWAAHELFHFSATPTYRWHV